MEIEYITTEDSGLLPKGTVFKPIGETNKEFKFLWGTPENFHSVTISKKICEINFGKKLYSILFLGSQPFANFSQTTFPFTDNLAL